MFRFVLAFFTFPTIVLSFSPYEKNLIAVFSPSSFTETIYDEIVSSQIKNIRPFTVVTDSEFLTKKNRDILSKKYKRNFERYNLVGTLQTKMRILITKQDYGTKNTVFIPNNIPETSKLEYLFMKNRFIVSNLSNSEYILSTSKIDDNSNTSVHFDFIPEFVNFYIFSDKQTYNSDFFFSDAAPSFSFFAFILFLVFLIVAFFRIMYILTKLNNNDYWFITTGGSVLSKPVYSYYILVKDLVRTFSSSPNENIICHIGAQDDQVVLFKFVRVCSYAYLVLFQLEDSMDEYMPNVEMHDGQYRSYDMVEPEPIICRTAIDQETKERQLEVEIKLYDEICSLICTPKQRCLSFGLHCLHARYVHRIYIGSLIDLLKIQTDADLEQCLENILDRMDFTGCGFFSIDDDEDFHAIILKSKDEDAKNALVTFASKIYGEATAIEVVTLNIGLFRVFGNRVKIGQYQYILCMSLPRNLLTIRASERQFQGFFSIVLSFHQLMNTDKQFYTMKRIVDHINHNENIAFYEFKDDKIINIFGFDHLHPETPNIPTMVNKNTGYFLVKRITMFDEVHDTNITLLYSEMINNYFNDFYALQNKLQFEIKINRLFEYEFALAKNTARLSKYLGYSTPQDLYSLVHPHDRKLLRTKRDVMNVPVRLLAHNNNYHYFIMPILHSINYAFISFPEFPNIIEKVKLGNNCISFPSEPNNNFVFWCIDPLTDRLIATLGSPCITSKMKTNTSQDIIDLIIETDKQTFKDSINDLLVSHNNEAQYMLQLLIDGDIRFFDVSVTLTAGYLLTVLAHDVTDHKTVLDSAAEITQLIDIGLLYSNVLIWFFDDNRDEELVYSAMPIAHKPFYMNWSTIEFNVVLEDQSKLTNQLKAALQSSSNVVDIEIPVMFDKIRWYMMRGMKSNKDNQLMGILVDTTELKSLSAQAKQQKLRAEEANSAKSRFLANMSHEIRTPLSGMSGLLELLEGTQLPPDSIEIVSCIRSSFTRLLELLNDTLDLAKMDQKKMIPQTVNFKTFETLLPVISSFEQRAMNNKIQLNVITAPDVPVLLSGDPHFLARITTNLISNSLKFTDYGSITVYFSYRNDNLCIDVEDTGVGFLPEEISTIYEPFPLIDSKFERPPRGTGACLALVKQMVDALNGTIDYVTEINKGTTFNITLPFESLMSPYVSPKMRKRHFKVLNLCPKIFTKDSFTKHFSDFYGFDVIFDNQSVDLLKIKLIVCQIDDLPKAKDIAKSAPNAKIIVITDRQFENKDKNITVFRNAEFWMRIQDYIFSKVLHSHEIEKVMIPESFRILVADDNSMNQIIIKKLLAKMKKRFVVVSDGTEVLETLKNDKDFNVIFMDHQMVKMDGTEATRLIRASNEWFKDIPIIAMTASTLKEDEDECISAGMNHFVSKPISMRKIEDEIAFAYSLPFNRNNNNK
ncbi:Response regulator receiver domain containing protein [Tritrichomonas foetus]|uniref:Response regulator receiver domain containing protein n=1 Tax=Tritrichomonas foetus TaxID=1144522 RepID=A0A1J4L2A8_9EUKA|nr:Response regulator receiver domain containing protein [Tritrichomonas foetus]|eukprot:OHT17649.1 Response regulator receiver domain containing protein [Tritrichomonas foetus]